jgi:hypothetical protein
MHVASSVAEYECLQNELSGRSQREIAAEIGVPRSTLQYWLARKQGIDAEPELVAFFESAVGIAFLHRLVVAAHFVMTMVGPSGIRVVCQFLELSGLDQFVASSYGSQQAVSVALEQAIVGYGEAEQERLSVHMLAKEITVCEDETFHPETCLVAIEPVSNYILLETYAPDRKAETWTETLSQSLHDMPVSVVQATSDEGRGLCHHIEQDLGVHHSPDLFHVQQAASKATSAPLAARVRQAATAVEKAEKGVGKHQTEQEKYLNQTPRPVGRPPDFAQRIVTAQAEVESSQAALDTALERQTQAKAAVLGISQSYHPFDLETGKAQDAETVAQALESHFAALEDVAAAAQLPERCLKNIHKAKRLSAKMVATIAFFFLTIQTKVEALSLTPTQEQAVHQQLIPAIYLQLVANKASCAEDRHALYERSQALLASLQTPDSPLFLVPQEERLLIESVASECAHLFQRSSSCTEGRNGQLALRHHGLHRISHRKLNALTVVHNFFLTRQDGSTAAQRFFDQPHRDLFGCLLTKVDLPGRPAQKRPPPPTIHCLI